MLVRGVFWIGIVALLMPHGDGAGPVAGASRTNRATVAKAPMADTFQDALLARLRVVKIEIEAAERIRVARGG
jgi:hypothetical protein